MYSFHQVVGHYDDVLDLAFVGERREHVAVATNFQDIRVLNTTSLSATSLHGHTDVVLALNCSRDGRILVSGSKVGDGVMEGERTRGRGGEEEEGHAK